MFLVCSASELMRRSGSPLGIGAYSTSDVYGRSVSRFDVPRAPWSLAATSERVDSACGGWLMSVELVERNTDDRSHHIDPGGTIPALFSNCRRE